MRWLECSLVLLTVGSVTLDTIPPGSDTVTVTTPSPTLISSSTTVSTTAADKAMKEVRMTKEEVKGSKKIMIKQFGEGKVFVFLVSFILILFRSQR